MRLYFLPGMTRGYPIYSRVIPLLNGYLCEEVCYPARGVTTWEGFLDQLCENREANSVFIGTSFGGLVAQEMANRLQARGCITLSSMTRPEDLPIQMQPLRWLPRRILRGALEVAGRSAATVGKQFGGVTLRRLSQLQGEAGLWHRWAIAELIHWKGIGPCPPFETLQIHGSDDSTFPKVPSTTDLVIPGGGHCLAISHSEEVAAAILQFLKRLES